MLAVALFKSSSNLAAAYGIAVTLDMLITTVLTFFVIRYGWGYNWLLCVGATGFFFVIDLAFFSSNLLKLTEGGWFPSADRRAIFLLMTTWHEGRRLLNESLASDALDLSELSGCRLHQPASPVQGTAVFLTAQPGVVPNALLHNLKHNKVLHEHNLFVTVRNHPVPWIGMDKRLEIESLGHDAWQLIVNYGFKTIPTAQGARAAQGPWRRARPDDDQLFPVARHRDPDHRRRRRSGARSCSPPCTTTRALPPSSSTCPTTQWSNSAPRSKSNHLGRRPSPGDDLSRESHEYSSLPTRSKSFKTHKDSTFAMMREAQRRGHQLMACQPADLMWQRGGRVTAFVRDITLTGDADD